MYFHCEDGVESKGCRYDVVHTVTVAKLGFTVYLKFSKNTLKKQPVGEHPRQKLRGFHLVFPYPLG